MEREAQNVYARAAARATDAETRKLLGDLAAAETRHQAKAESLTERHLGSEERAVEEQAARRQFLLTWVQPGLAGLMDGSVSTLAPIFATAFATRDPWTTFLIGLSASVGAGISMGFTEAAHDDGKLSGRGSPWKRGLASGVMTTLGGLGHAGELVVRVREVRHVHRRLPGVLDPGFQEHGQQLFRGRGVHVHARSAGDGHIQVPGVHRGDPGELPDVVGA